MLSNPATPPLDLVTDESSDVINSDDLIDTIKTLTHDLANSREETRKAEDQISCLVSLIKRSWRGDRAATTHLANIIGFPDPYSGQLNGTSNNQEKQNGGVRSRAVHNWDRLSLKLLEREYARVEHEIRTRQNMYMRHRELYFEEVLNTHDENMARIPFHRKSSGLSIEEIDTRFLQQQRAKSATGFRVASAAKVRQRRQLPKGPRDIIRPAEVQLSDFFIQNSQPEVSSNVNKGISSLYQYSQCVDNEKPNRPDPGTNGSRPTSGYGDPQRYAQPNLFEAVSKLNVVGPGRPRPVSAAVLRERGRLRTRPKSAGVQSYLERTGKVEGLKGSVRPPSSRPSSNKPPVPRLNLDESRHRHNSRSLTREDATATYIRNPLVCSAHKLNNSLEVLDQPTKPSITVRIRSAVKRPECIDNFENDVQKMTEMEDQFRKTTLQLQKKLGIDKDSLVY